MEKGEAERKRMRAGETNKQEANLEYGGQWGWESFILCSKNNNRIILWIRFMCSETVRKRVRGGEKKRRDDRNL